MIQKGHHIDGLSNVIISEMLFSLNIGLLSQ